jgi:hypothetical protein
MLWISPVSGRRILPSTFATSVWLSSDFDRFVTSRPSTSPSFLFRFCPEDEIVVLLVGKNHGARPQPKLE